jgi:hypothetical protein
MKTQFLVVSHCATDIPELKTTLVRRESEADGGQRRERVACVTQCELDHGVLLSFDASELLLLGSCFESTCEETKIHRHNRLMYKQHIWKLLSSF